MTNQASVEETTRPHTPTIPNRQDPSQSKATSFRHNASKIILEIITQSSSATHQPSVKHLSTAREIGPRLTAQNLWCMGLVNFTHLPWDTQGELRPTQSKINAQILNAHHEDGWRVLPACSSSVLLPVAHPTCTVPVLELLQGTYHPMLHLPHIFIHLRRQLCDPQDKTEPVLCRSAVSSRSASQLRDATGRSCKASAKGAGKPASPNHLPHTSTPCVNGIPPLPIFKPNSNFSFSSE
ncbi:hypothetical protein FRC02_009641 [Tulasnella sp. 418]|nr:hypothetical protein FRC02_009641 [Tulasnella sp. 418]